MPSDDAHAAVSVILTRIQSAVDARDAEALADVFDDAAVLVGTASHSRGETAIRNYLAAVVAQPGSLHWDWGDVVVFYESPGAVGFATFGDIVVTDHDGQQRAPIRLTAFAVRSPDGWRLRQFHGSIPSAF